MKLSCLQENLSKGVMTVSRLVATKGTLEILSHILLSTESGRLKLSATNLEIGINYKVGAKIDSDGSITVPAKLFSELITQLPEGKIDISVSDNTLSAKIDGFNSSIKGLSADEFPLIPKIKDKKTISIKAGELKDAISMVFFSAAPDETRPVLSGIYFNISKGKLSLVSTDSYRLSEKVINLKSKEIPEKEAIIPARTMIELARIIDDSEKEVNIYLDETQIMFETDDFELTSRLIEGKFPDYKQIIPAGSETKAVVEKDAFASIIRVASLFSRESAGSVSLQFSNKGKIEVISSASQYGEADSSCEAEVEGKDTEIIFNSKYILDVLNNLPAGKVEIELSGKLNPGVIKKQGDKDFTYVIMPLRA